MSLQADYLIPTDFGLSEERKMMIDMLKKFKEKECPKEKIAEWDEASHFPVDVWKKLGNEGILGAFVFDCVCTCDVCTQLWRPTNIA